MDGARENHLRADAVVLDLGGEFRQVHILDVQIQSAFGPAVHDREHLGHPRNAPAGELVALPTAHVELGQLGEGHISHAFVLHVLADALDHPLEVRVVKRHDHAVARGADVRLRHRAQLPAQFKRLQRILAARSPAPRWL